jgi:hypothetical protein
MDAVSIAPASTPTPAVHVPQRMQALDRANQVRIARAGLKRSISRGELELSEVIRECPWETESMPLGELLTSQRNWGHSRARKLLFSLDLSENKRLGTLTPRQRALLSSALSTRAADREPILPSPGD